MNEYKYKLLEGALEEKSEFLQRLLDVLNILPDTTELKDRVNLLLNLAPATNLQTAHSQIRDSQ